MKNAETGTEEEEEDEAAAIRRAVKDLHFGGWEAKEAAAAAIRDSAKRDASKKRAFAELGVVSSLISMLVEAKEGSACQRLALEALSELAHGSFRNKILMIDSGLLSKLPQLHSNASISTKHSLTPLLLSISSLAKAQFPLDSLPFLSFLIPLLRSPSPPNTPAILALHNLSTQLSNSKPIVSAGAVHLLLRLCFLQPALATLVNLAVTEEGERAIEEDALVPRALVDAMTSGGEVKSQEQSVYLLMVVARRSGEKRRGMVRMGAAEMAVELALDGRSGLVRERAAVLLQWLKEGDEKVYEGEIRWMVKQSLHRNMESLMRRREGSAGCNRLPC